MISMRAFCNTRTDFHMEKTGIAPKEPTTDGIIFTLTFQISVTPLLDLDTFLSFLSPSPQSYYFQELQNQ